MIGDREGLLYFFASFLILLLMMGLYFALLYAAVVFMAEWMSRIITNAVNKHGD